MMTPLLDDTTALDSTPADGPGVENLEQLKSLAEQVGQKIVRLAVCVRMYRGAVALPAPKVSQDEIDLEVKKDCTSPSLYVLPPAWRKRMETIEGRIRRAASRDAIKTKVYSHNEEDFLADLPSWDLADVIDISQDSELAASLHAASHADKIKKGPLHEEGTVLEDCHMLTAETAARNAAEVERLRVEEWRPACRELIETFPAIVKALQSEKSKEVFRLIRPHLPKSSTALARRFGVHCLSFPLGISADHITLETIQKGAGSYLKTVVQSFVVQTFQKLEEACSHVRDAVVAKKQLKQSSLDAVAGAISLFKTMASMGVGMDGSGAANLLKTLDDAQTTLASTSCSDLNASVQKGQGNTAATIMSLMDAVTKAMDSSSATAGRFGGMAREILV